MDFAQPSRSLTEAQFTSLAHRLARFAPPGDALTARIIDKVAQLQRDRLQDWEFLEEIRAYRNEASSRVPEDLENKYHSWIETEAVNFLKRHHVIGEPEVLAAIDEDVPE